MHAQDAGDTQECRDPGVGRAGLDGLVGGAGDVRGKEDTLLGAVVVEPGDADAVADGAALLEEPLVVVGQAGHAVNAGPIMILSQPGKPGIIRS